MSNVVELLLLEELQEDEGANVDLDAHKTKCAVIKTSTRATYFLPVVGLVDPSELKPGDLVGVNKVCCLFCRFCSCEHILCDFCAFPA